MGTRHRCIGTVALVPVRACPRATAEIADAVVGRTKPIFTGQVRVEDRVGVLENGHVGIEEAAFRVAELVDLEGPELGEYVFEAVSHTDLVFLTCTRVEKLDFLVQYSASSLGFNLQCLMASFPSEEVY